MQARRWTQMTIRRLMLIVAIAAVALTVIPPLWRYWFATPIRKVIYRVIEDEQPVTVSVSFDTRDKQLADRFEDFTALLESFGTKYRVERTTAPDEQSAAGYPPASTR